MGEKIRTMAFTRISLLSPSYSSQDNSKFALNDLKNRSQLEICADTHLSLLLSQCGMTAERVRNCALRFCLGKALELYQCLDQRREDPL